MAAEMRALPLLLVALILCGCVQQEASQTNQVDKTYPVYPNFLLSPGDVLTTDTSIICTVGYTKTVRDVPDSLKKQVYAEYGVTPVPYAYEIDHVISLELGGSNDVRNLFPEPYNISLGARQKDVVENYLHKQVCQESMSIQEAQQLIVYNWTDVYARIKGP